MARRPHAVMLLLIALLTAATAARAQDPGGGTVVLPVDEYRELRARALATPPDPPLPVQAALTSVEYDLRAEGGSVTGRARLTIDVLRDGWVQVPIPVGLLVRDARLDDAPVSLVRGPSPHVLLPRAGRFLLDLDIVAPVVASAGRDTVTLPAAAATIVRSRLTLPGTNMDLTVNGGFVADRSDTPVESRWSVLGRANTPLTMTWQRRADDRRGELPLRTRARIAQLVTLSEDLAAVTATVRTEVLQGLVHDLVLTVPEGVIVNQVDGPTVADWDLADGVLRVRLLEAAASEVSFVVQAESRVPRDGRIAVPIVRMPSADREDGGLAVDVAGAGQIVRQQTRGLEAADPGTLGDLITARQSPSMAAFRFRPAASRDVALTVELVRYTAQAVLVTNVDEARYRVLAAEDGPLMVQGRYAVRNNQRSFLKVSLPAGGRVWSASLNGRPVHPGVAPDGGVLLPLEKGRAGEDAPSFAVELVYFQPASAWSEKGQAMLSLPAIDVPVSRTGVDVRYSPRYRVTLASAAGPFRAAQDEGPYAPVLRGATAIVAGVVGGAVEAPSLAAPVAAPPPPVPAPDQNAAQLQSLVDRFRNEAGARTVAGTLPVQVPFPDFGLSLFLAAELTAESQAAVIPLAFRRIDN